MTVLRIRGGALTEIVQDRFEIRVEYVEVSGRGVEPGDVVSLRLPEGFVIYWIGDDHVACGTEVHAAIVVPLAVGEPADTLDLQLNNVVLEGFLPG